jgi:hypothetical protein
MDSRIEFLREGHSELSFVNDQAKQELNELESKYIDMMGSSLR